MISEEKVKRYCADFTQIENYDVAISDNSEIWDCHHRLETHNSDGVKRSVFLSKSELKALGVYITQMIITMNLMLPVIKNILLNLKINLI